MIALHRRRRRVDLVHLQEPRGARQRFRSELIGGAPPAPLRELYDQDPCASLVAAEGGRSWNRSGLVGITLPEMDTEKVP